jgi:hypothetical protein
MNVTTTTSCVRLERLLCLETSFRQESKELRHKLLLNSNNVISVIWRDKVAQWYYNVLDSWNESRSVVYVALNILDRYCCCTMMMRDSNQKSHSSSSSSNSSTSHSSSSAAPSVTWNERNYELASLSALFLAVRIAGSGTYDLELPELVSLSSRRNISTREVMEMGKSMIAQLSSWKERIVTPLEFVRLYLQLSQDGSSSSSILTPRLSLEILNEASYLLELSVCDVALTHARPSLLALAAILQAMLQQQQPSSHNLIHTFYTHITNTIHARESQHAFWNTSSREKIRSLCAQIQAVTLQNQCSSSSSNNNNKSNSHAAATSNYHPHIIVTDEDDDETPKNTQSTTHHHHSHSSSNSLGELWTNVLCQQLDSHLFPTQQQLAVSNSRCSIVHNISTEALQEQTACTKNTTTTTTTTTKRRSSGKTTENNTNEQSSKRIKMI